MKKIKIVLLLGIVLLSSTQLFSQSIEWLTIEEAQKKCKTEPKVILVDVYTDWCGWCKKYDATTFKNPVIVNYINTHYYAVKLDAEEDKDITFSGKTYSNDNPGKSRSYNQLAKTLMNNKMSFPTIVFIDGDLSLITSIPGYMDAKAFEPVVNYIKEKLYLQSVDFEKYNEEFEGEVED